MEDTDIVSYKKHYGEDIAIIVMLYLVIFFNCSSNDIRWIS